MSSKARVNTREIKFRAWDCLNRVVGYEKWYSGCLDSKNFWTAKPCFLYSKDNKNWNPTPIIYRYKDQYTGLKDKNNKEIYEKDKVVISVTGDSVYNSTVIFKDGAFRCSYYGRTLPSKPHEIEVIGNEFERQKI